MEEESVKEFAQSRIAFHPVVINSHQHSEGFIIFECKKESYMCVTFNRNNKPGWSV